ncbi:glycosyltransferase [Gillisia limnaea]|uniref:Glycosyl transferase family 1 n=1 Tax=Gillisia limnaea (strain DSM 15749 / LMG 21470 / R-8282) TaxID=865937 RepID=H2BV69_GILLR|nr:glycosyltransferase [Gillisia limnaea]EHQ01734.1 hypothetical protein Gilli_1058 [Gillisia limnaea DSM 15749]
MDRVTVFFNSTLLHFSQLISGLQYLKGKKEVDLSYQLNLNQYPVHIFRIDYNGLNLFFDMSDNSEIDWKIYEESDFYIKRMLNKTDFEQYEKLVPYGLNYQVYYNNNFLKYLFLKDRKLLKYSLRFSKSMSLILNIKDCVKNNCLSKMESKPSMGRQILFRARLWNPDNNETDWKKKERIILNEERISINRLLKRDYNRHFKGGIQKDSFSESQCPDLLLSKKEYHKSTYLKELKASSIGIVNQGLENSISWKMGEYVAHGLAIITSSIDEFELPGDFEEGENYLKYESVEECLEMTELLFKDDKLRARIQKNNENYYLNYLHPGAKIIQIFNCVNEKRSS